MDDLLGAAALTLLIVCIILFIRRYNRNEERKGCGNPARFHFTLIKNSFSRCEDDLYTPNRKINRHWRS